MMTFSNSFDAGSRSRGAIRLTVLAVCAAACVTGCTTASHEEQEAQRQVAAVGNELGVSKAPGRSGARVTNANVAADLAVLRNDSTETDFIRFAVHHHPAIRAAYFNWKASVAAIAPARALPDPEITFQADIAETLMSLMPGLMFEGMAESKRQALAHQAAAAGAVAYREYVTEVADTVGALRRAWVELAYAQDTDRLYRRTIHAAEQAVALASTDYTTGRATGDFAQQVRFENMLAEHHSHHAGVAARLESARAQFKFALGLQPTDPDPPWPAPRLQRSEVPAENELWDRIRAQNPELARLRAMVDLAVAGVAAARASGTPDFSAGLMVDLRQNPVMFRPTATLTLPVWREKIRAGIAAAEAQRDAALARLGADQLTLAARLAQVLSLIRESDSMLSYMTGSALPNLNRSVASAQAAAESGRGSPTLIAETELMAIDVQHRILDVLRDREIAVVDLGLLLNDALPADAPLARRSESPARPRG